MADKHTKRELFETLVIFASAAEADAWVIEGLEHELELLDRKRNGSKGNAKLSAEQAAIMRNIEGVLAASTEPMRANAITDALADGTAIQRVSALLKKMVDSGTVVRSEGDKKVALFTLS